MVRGPKMEISSYHHTDRAEVIARKHPSNIVKANFVPVPFKLCNS